MRYLGNKESIAETIKNIILDKVQITTETVLFDAFCGTGSVANIFKNICSLVVNDNLNCMATYTYGRLVASTCKFTKLGFDPFEYLNNSERSINGYFWQSYSPGKSNRMYFTEENAKRIDYFRKTIEDWFSNDLLTENEYKYLLFCLIESVSSVSNTAGVYGAFLKKWDNRALKKIDFHNIGDNIPLLSNVQSYTRKIEEIISDIDCDILYLDPPYTQNQYGTQYHLLETLILDDEPENISIVTGSRNTAPMRSDWSKKYKVHILLDKVVAETKAKHIFLSYSSAGDMSKDYIEAVLKRYGVEETFACYKIPYKKYENWKSENKNDHFEYLFYIQKKETSDVIYECPLNYTGSKAKIISSIKREMVSTDCFVDVFGGGFNVGANIHANKIIYNDINYMVKDLIESFFKYDTYDFILFVKKFIEKHNLEIANKETYLKARDYYNNLPLQKKDPRILFAIILYSFQQQIRFNGNHEFNNPVGNRWFNDCILEKLISFSRIIKKQNVLFSSIDYIDLEKVVKPDKNTFLYFDPPYKLTTGSYNDGKRGFKGWNNTLELELFNFIDTMTAKDVPCMLSYVYEHKGEVNKTLAEWVKRNNYRYIELGNVIGISGLPRKEILITNYDLFRKT